MKNNSHPVEVCSNLTFLGRFGMQTICGLKIVYLSGVYDSTKFTEEQQDAHRWYYSKHDLKKLDLDSVDVLLTSEWGRGFHHSIAHCPNPPVKELPRHLSFSDLSMVGSPIVAKLVVRCRPKYHFAATQRVFYKLRPYKNVSLHQNEAAIVTRFIALGSFGKRNDAQAVYALKLTPGQSVVFSSYNGICDCPPYILPAKEIVPTRKRRTQEQAKPEEKEERALKRRKIDQVRWSTTTSGAVPPEGYVCHKCGEKGHFIRECRSQSKSARVHHSGGECWFCLGSARLEDHMIVSVGKWCYVALAKGPLLVGESGFHLLITPIQHVPSTVELDRETKGEMDRYLGALRECFAQEAMVVCDRKLFTRYSAHCYLEVFLMKKKKDEKKQEDEKELEEQVQGQGVEFVKVVDNDGKDCFFTMGLEERLKKSIGYLVMFDVDSGVKYVHKVEDEEMNKKMALNFMRKVVARYLGLQERFEWTSCVQEKKEETQLTDLVKEKFKKYDWSLGEKNAGE